MNNLEKILSQKNIKKSEFARRLGVSRQRVNNWIREKNYPSIKYIKLISYYLKISIDELFKD